LWKAVFFARRINRTGRHLGAVRLDKGVGSPRLVVIDLSAKSQAHDRSDNQEEQYFVHVFNLWSIKDMRHLNGV
jgi:hypothetical protein